MENGKIVTGVIGITAIIGILLAIACVMTVQGFAFIDTLGVVLVSGTGIAGISKLVKIIMRYARAERRRSF